nr:putative ribonuclease H-like domain-containing protein [Tanacetum cinerariifolium]
CDNGTEFKYIEMNQFCEMKGILRQFSVAKTRQQNRVAERRNMTLIEVATTMLADSNLPTTFWVQAVNTACYVQNRLLIVKPHNKTPYELFHGSRPDWLFDIDALTRTMNYEPIVAGTQSNDYVDPKSSHDDGFKPSSDDEKKVNDDLRKENECNNQENEDNVNSTNNVNTVNVAGTNDDNELSFDPNMPALEDVGTFNFSNGDEYDDIVAEINNMDTTIQDSPIPSTRIHKDHHLDQVIEDLHSATQTRQMLKNLEEHRKIKEEVYKNDGIFISQDKYDAEILKKFGFIEVKNASTPMETQKPLLKDEDGEEVDVDMYRSMIGSLMYLTSSRPDIMFAVHVLDTKLI